jgi:HTH-type transcriptional repressor of NAD biosynthesis genes
MALVDYALSRCDELVLVVCATERDEPIHGLERLRWVTQTYGGNPRIRIDYVDDMLPGGRKSTRAASNVWGEFCLQRFPRIDVIISSERYGQYMAEYMDCDWDDCDLQRRAIPISATMIRKNPYKHWGYISEVAKPDFVTKICVYGSESCGKTTISKQLAEHYGAAWVPETARDLLGDRHCEYEDFEFIAARQAGTIRAADKNAPRLTFCDTDLLTTKVYSEVYYDKVPEVLLDLLSTDTYDFRVFLTPDVGWVEDTQRDLGHRREELHRRFMDELEKNGIEDYAMVGGDWTVRFKNALGVVETFLANDRKVV